MHNQRAAGKKKKGSTRQSFLHGALILTAAILLVKVIGALFKIPLNWIISEDGMGYFSTAYNFYSPIFSLATAGFPIAIARLVSENYARGNYRDIRMIHRASIPIFLTTGTVGFLIMELGARSYVNIVGNENALPSMIVLAPAILFSCLSSIYRGYYEGMRNMYPTALSEVTEALGKLVIGLSCAWGVITYGMNEYAASGTVFGQKVESEAFARAATLPYAAAGAILGVTMGSLLGFIVLFIRHRRRGDGITKEQLRTSHPSHTMHYTVVRLIKIAIPIGIGSLLVNVANLVDTTFLQTRIGDIMANSKDVLLSMYNGLIPDYNLKNPDSIPNFLYGCYANAMTLYMLVPSITQAFGISALPNVTSAWTRGDRREIKKSIETVMRVTALVAIPAGLGMSVLAQPIVSLIYGSHGASQIIARALIIMGIGAIFASLSTPLQSMLQAVGRVDLPVKLLMIGLLIKVALNYTLCGIPEINILGAGTGTVVCYAFITVMSVVFLCRVTGIVPNLISVFLKPLIAGGLCALAAFLAYNLVSLILPGKVATLAAIIVACVVYVIALLCLRVIQRSDVRMLPKGQKIEKILEKHGWIG